MQLLRERDTVIPLTRACRAIGVSLATAKRHLRPKQKVTRERLRSPNHRCLSSAEKEAVVEVLHSARFIDQPPRQVYAELLEKGTYLASVRTMYRILAERKETRERRDQRAPKSHPAPRVVATRPNQVWTWDITKLPTYVVGVFLNLYLVLDLFSRYPVAWMVAERENSALSKQLLSEAISRYRIEPGTLTVHNDRGAPMTAVGFIELLAELGAARSLSRPRVSNGV